MKRYGIKLPVEATLKDYKIKFTKISGIKKDNYLLLEVYQNKIVKNYSTAKDEATLTELQLREGDQIYAYELLLKFDEFIWNYYRLPQIDFDKDFQKG